MSSNAKIKRSARLFSEYKDKRLALQKEVNELDKKEKLHKVALMKGLTKAKMEGIKVSGYLYALVEKDEPIINKPELLYKHIKKTGNFDLLRRQLNPTAVKQRWDDGKKVPGVQGFPVVTLSVTKA